MKYFVELSTLYRETYCQGRLYSVINGHLTDEEGGYYEMYPDMEDETGYMVTI